MSSFSVYPETTELDHGAFAMLSPAKINLRLQVIGRRRDGFHELDTLFQEISLADRLEFHPAREWSLEVRDAELETDERNIVTRAARLLAVRAGVPCQARIVLHKQIPTGGGLGGGSSNAAVALMGLTRLWKLDLSKDQLHPLAAELGSDCAFFLHGGLARGLGRGEIIELLEDRLENEILLVLPPFGISTAEVYSWSEFPLTHDEKSVILESCVKLGGSTLSDFDIFRNDLEPLVLRRYPEIVQLKRTLLDQGAEHALLSGSGSCIFGVYSNHTRALRAAQHIREPYRVVISQTMSRPRSRA